MTVNLTRTGSRWLTRGLAALLLAGCASVTKSPEMLVRERATALWQVKLAGDYDAAYTFMPPSYRAITTLASYKKSFGAAVKLIAAEVEQVKCESPDKCVTTTKIEAKALLQRASVPPIVTGYDEIWVRENGQWWLFPTP